MGSSLWMLPDFKIFMLVLFLSVSLRDIRSVAQPLPAEEVEAMISIASKLRYSNWTVASDSCSGGFGLNNIISLDENRLMESGSNVTCDCSNTTVCHISRIQLRRLSLAGVLPEEFLNLPFLTEIDLSRNYINGTIPSRFSQLNVTILNLMGNRIGGSIPEEIGDMSSLEELFLQDNLLGGPLPQNLSRLPRLRRVLISGNNFTGTIPESYGNLIGIRDFRIDGNSLSGRIPDFIGNWTNITRLDLQGTSMEGPIPPSISRLTNLQDLRITDLAGTSSSTFPDLRNMTQMIRLVLRNCLLTGSIPEDIGELSRFKIIDLSFNSLSGQIPNSFQPLSQTLEALFLNNNSLSGDIPTWVFSNQETIDLSYNNFTQSQQQTCTTSRLNLVSALSPSARSNRDAWCLNDQHTCSRNPDRHSLFINCGGDATEFEGNEYERDTIDEGSYFYYVPERWAYSTSGVFVSRDKASFVVSRPNATVGEIYRTARVAPTSLRYYGLCLRPGSYKVRLHFAEISYTSGTTYSSLGRRYFDISIQGLFGTENGIVEKWNREMELQRKGIGLENEN